MSRHGQLDHDPYTPRRWTIDLSLPPKDRYRELAKAYKDDVQDLTQLFNSLLHDIAVPERWIPTINRLSRLLLRRVHDQSQTEELQGISEESGIPMYLLVSFNVILDLLMGCTSGGVRALTRNTSLTDAKMLHFRTLDWSMDPLREIVVQLDFVRSKSHKPDQIIASTITYVGFTGVLTGVRPGLSMSLNFRGLHDNCTKTSQIRFYFHHLLVLFGRRPSIAAYLRDFLIGDQEAMEAGTNLVNQTSELIPPPQLENVVEKLRTYHTTAAYLIFSDGDSTMCVDKDYRTIKFRTSENFIATTNHDVLDHGDENQVNVVAAKAVPNAARNAAGLEDFLEESEDRLKCLSNRWQRLIARRHKAKTGNGETVSIEEVAAQTALTTKQVIEWLSKYPTTNECTHFAAVMDPKEGSFIWCKAYPQPLRKEQVLQLEL